MLGYVLPDKGDLKVREYEVYSAYYCGICKSVGRRYGQLPRFTLSYDFVFLAVLLASMEKEKEDISGEHCIIHHIKKRPVAKNNSAVDYAGDVMLILAYYKLMDDYYDDRSYKSGTLALGLRPTVNRLRRKMPKLCHSIKENLKTLSDLENKKCPSLDEAAEPFAQIMANIFTGFLSKENVTQSGDYGQKQDWNCDEKQNWNCDEKQDGNHNKKQNWNCGEKQDGNYDEKQAENHNKKQAATEQLLRHIGYNLGKWIYLMDAFEDIEENITKKTYNPLIYRFNFANGEDLKNGSNREALRKSICDFKKEIKPAAEMNLMHYLAEISNAAELLEIKKNKGIIDNIIYFGLLRRTEKVLEEGTEVNNEGKER